MNKELKSFVDIEVMDKFPSQHPIKSFFNYVQNLVGLEGALSVAGILAPDLIEEAGCVFLKENYPVIANNGLYKVYGDDRKSMERYVNTLCLSDFYLLAADEASSDEELLLKLAEIIVKFWSMYLEKLFPARAFQMEISKDGLFDEYGVCITFSQL
ncbi:hypothetical protein HNQ91_000510 [Filimonas zeae]|uniref:Uncharacterized protein n=1 Tax=Filimonas zeae TaxID=1737353 RepID=A0A917IQH9_9BACT|nr:hypothetical protein [Filimonas zeae]MDR6337488.1 hypothetical protein [Filimonas zeae]GGH58861.1 hypothetical protein GCM10011379_05000 [Filimonas zeae]